MRRLILVFVLFVTVVGLAASAPAQRRDRRSSSAESTDNEPESRMSAKTFRGLALRSLGPAVASGRVVDFAVPPHQRKVYYAATASGGLWKTTNAGTTWTPIFDDQGSYSIGCVTLDAKNPLVVWVGTGENNSQRSVAYGDGVYKSLDGGSTWKNVGLGESEHIGMVTIDPRDSDVVYVAAQGPLWRAGGDRGLYKTADGGDSWERILHVDEHTGASEVHLDPRDPDTLFVVTYQRRRRQWTLVNGGPGSALHKSSDGGATWTKLERGLPDVEMGRIGLAVAPSRPDTLYAIIEAQDDDGGLYRSLDGGSHWEKRGDHVASSPQYYQELVPDPVDADRLYSLDTYLMVSDDGGATFRRLGQEFKHVDEHALWIDPGDTDYLLSGNDGGIYESFDGGRTWAYKANLPITQFYKIAVDDDTPFYNVYGGTQDNNTLGGPSRTVNQHGITNGDWYVTVAGDGFQPAVDPANPDIVYSQSQYGNLRRFDRRSGETLDIRPREGEGDEPLRWNWDSPLVVSPHQPSRLYYAAQRVFRSEDRGDSWTAISPDLSRGIDRDRLEVMGRLQSVDAVARHDSTSMYGTVVSLAESSLVEDLLYAGTDDGQVQVLEPGTDDWRAVASFPGIPEGSYVARLQPSRHDPDTVYAAFNNHKSGDFLPYLRRSADRGATWTDVTGDLPQRGSLWAIVEDHVDPELLFAGSEFGVFFTVDGGGRWLRLEGGMPVISVRDLALQRRESDLVVGTFGRGFYVLDDYTPLRSLDTARLEEQAILFPVKDPWMYFEATPLGELGKGHQGHAYYTAPNPPFGAVFTYYLKDELSTLRQRRRQQEKQAIESGADLAQPSWEELEREDRERPPEIVLEVRDETGDVLRHLSGPTAAGIHRIAWDLRLPAATPTTLEAEEDESIFRRAAQGPIVVPGRYSVSLVRIEAGERTAVGERQSFEARPLGLATLAADDRAELAGFQRRTARLQRAVTGAVRAAGEAKTRIDHLRRALRDTPGAPVRLVERLEALEERLADLRVELEGDTTRGSRNAPAPPSIADRVQSVVRGHWSSSSAATATQRDSYRLAADAFAPVLAALRQLIEVDLGGLEEEMEAAGAPWTPGRVPVWEP